MDSDFDKKINICRRLGGTPIGDKDEDFHCDGVDEFKFQRELDKEK